MKVALVEVMLKHQIHQCLYISVEITTATGYE